MSMRYLYGMKFRPAGPGCQPKEGLICSCTWNNKGDQHYWSVLQYNRRLADDEVSNYDLEYITEYDYVVAQEQTK